MNIKSLLSAASAGAVLAAIVCGPAAAAGFYVREQSVRGLGRAFSGEAADTGAASLWWNPASIGGTTGRGDVYMGIHHVDISADIRDTGSTIQRPVPGLPVQPVGGGGLQTNPVDKGDVPNLGAAWRLNDQWAVGVTVNAPFNFTTRYPLNSFTRYQALKSRLFNIDIQPTLAWTPVPALSIGVGFDFNYADATLSNALPNPSPLLPDAGSNLTGRGWDHGWVAGAQWRATDRVTLGASYRSSVKHVLNGQVTVNGLLGPAAAGNIDTPGVARFETPSILTLSARMKATDRLTLNVQLQNFDWRVFDAIRVEFAGRTQVTPQDYHDTTTLSFGADYTVNPQWTVRAGVQRDPTPTPDIGRTARVPDGDRWFYAAGLTFSPREKLAVDLAAGYLALKTDSLSSSATAFAGTPLNTPINMQGSISGHGVIVSGGVRIGF